MGAFDDIVAPKKGAFDDLVEGSDKSNANRAWWQHVADSGSLGRFAVGAGRGIENVLYHVTDTPAKWLARAVTGGPTMSQLVTGQDEVSKMDKRRKEVSAAYQAQLGDSTAAKIGEVGGEILATAPVGGLLAAPFRGAQVAAAKYGLPTLGKVAEPIALALETAGMKTGLSPASFGGKAANLGLRSAAGGTVGYTSAGAVNPQDANLGGLLGAAIPVAGVGMKAAGKAISETIKPFRAAGQKEIAGNIVRNAASDAQALEASLARSPNGIAPLSLPEVANDPGISGLSRTIGNRFGDYQNALTAFEHGQNAKRFGFLGDLAGNEQTIAGLEKARQAATEPLLAKAMAEAKDVGTKGVHMFYKDFASSPAYQRKAVRSTMETTAQPFKNAEGKFNLRVPFDTAWGARQNVDDLMRGVGDGMDQRIADASMRQLVGVRERLNTALSNASPGFPVYSQKYAEMSTPIDAVKTLQDLAKRATTNTADMAGNPIVSGAKLNQALKGIEPQDWAKLSASQQASITKLADELSAASRVKTLGKATGSNTAQNLFSDAVLQGNMPPLARAMISGKDHGGLLGSILNATAGGARDKIYGEVGQMLLDPTYTKNALFPAAKSMSVEELRRAALLESLKRNGGLLGVRAGAVAPAGLLVQPE